MQAIRKSVRSALIVALVFTFAFASGIPAIVLGAKYKIWAVMGIGIACTVAGFYGTPLSWTSYSSKRALERLVSAIVEEHIDTVNGLAAQLSLSEKEVRSRLDQCFRRKFLPGFRRDGDRIVLNDAKAIGGKEYAASCPYCGAKFTYTQRDPRCPYCGSPAMRE